MQQTLAVFFTYWAGLLTWMPAVHLALGLLALTTVSLGGGVLSLICFKNNPRGRSLAARYAIALTAGIVGLDLLAQATWNYSDGQADAASQVSVSISAPFAKPIAQIIHPGERLAADSVVDALGQSLTRERMHDNSIVVPTYPPAVVYHALQSTWPMQLEGDFFGLWVLIATLLLLRRVLGQAAVARVARSSREIDDPNAAAVFGQLLDDYRLPRAKWRRTRLRVSDKIDAPFVSGFLSFTLFVPAAALSDARAGGIDLRAMLAHELAHARRADPLFAFLAQVLCAACWFQPLTWIMARLAETSAESAADADTLTVGGCEAPAYADLLHRIAAGRVRPLTEAVAGVGMMPRRSQLAARIEQIVRGGMRAASIRVTQVQRIGLAIVCGCVLALTVGACFLRYVPSDADAAAAGKIILAPAWDAGSDALSGYALASRNGWSIAPVQAPIPGTIIGASSGSFGSPIDERRQACVAVLNRLTYLNAFGPGYQPPLAERNVVERILAKFPHFFYAEEILGAWYAANGEDDKARQWHRQALADAPQIIAGQLLIEKTPPTANSGAVLVPAAGFRFLPNITITSRWSQNQNLNATRYSVQVITDETGHFYVPCFAGIMDMGLGVDWNSGGSSVTDRLADKYALEQAFQNNAFGFVSKTRIGVVAPFILRPYLRLTVNGRPQPRSTFSFGPDYGRDMLSQTVALRGDQAIIACDPRSDANGYQFSVSEYVNTGSGIESRGITPSASIQSQPTARISFGPGGLGLVSGRVYELNVTAMSTADRSGYSNANSITRSNPLYFNVPDQPAKLPLTAETLNSYLKGGLTDVRIVKHPAGAIIKFRAHNGLDCAEFFSRGLFGYKTGATVEQTDFSSITPKMPSQLGTSLYTVRLGNP